MTIRKIGARWAQGAEFVIAEMDFSPAPNHFTHLFAARSVLNSTPRSFAPQVNLCNMTSQARATFNLIDLPICSGKLPLNARLKF
jgi:hypothetical protein